MLGGWAMSRRGSEELFEKIYDTYYENVYRYIYSSVKDKKKTEEIIDEVFTKLYKNIDKIHDAAHSKAFVFKIAHSEINNFYGNNDKVISIKEFLGKEKEAKKFTNINRRNEISCVKDMIEQLPHETKDMINMRYYGNLKFKQIAEVTNTAEKETRHTIFKAVKKVSQMFDSMKLKKTSVNR